MKSLISLNEIIDSRQGIMVIGKPITGKTTALKVISETKTQIYLKEYDEKEEQFLVKKRRCFGHDDSTIVKMGQTEENSLEANTVNDAETKMILKTCKNKKINQIIINPTA